MADKRKEELWCHDCGNYVQFTLDYDLDGAHVLNCPVCGHEHYRIIRRGRITAERWGRDPRQQVYSVSPTTITASTTSMDTWSTTGNTVFAYSTVSSTSSGTYTGSY